MFIPDCTTLSSLIQTIGLVTAAAWTGLVYLPNTPYPTAPRREPPPLSSLRTGPRDFLVVQWLRFCAPAANGMGSIPGQGTRIPYAAQ